jgi:hypothetical protein
MQKPTILSIDTNNISLHDLTFMYHGSETLINFEVSRSNEPTQPTIPSPTIYFFMQIAMSNIHALPIIL